MVWLGWHRLRWPCTCAGLHFKRGVPGQQLGVAVWPTAATSNMHAMSRAEMDTAPIGQKLKSLALMLLNVAPEAKPRLGGAGSPGAM
jgi:hypothetical protein